MRKFKNILPLWDQIFLVWVNQTLGHGSKKSRKPRAHTTGPNKAMFYDGDPSPGAWFQGLA